MSTIGEQQKVIRDTCRAYLSLPLIPISQQQAQSSGKRGSKGGEGAIAIDHATFPAPPEDDLKNALFDVIEGLKSPDHDFTSSTALSQVDTRVEFVRDDMRATNRGQVDSVILYMHGGGLFFSSPAEYRAATVRLARLTGSVVASTSYRLCPQNTFPAPLLDVLLAYATLLNPPATAVAAKEFPAATPPSKIVLAGNSAGVNLAFSLTKFLLELNKRADPTVMFHGRRVHIPLPAGITVASGWCDQTDCLPSWLNPNGFDILTSLQPALWPDFPSDNLWPSKPPREHPYTRAMNLDHELISPIAVRDWTGAPPMWFAVGELERGRDGNVVVASQAARCGVHVTWTEWQGMCHEYMVITRLPQASMTLKLWAEACNRFLERNKADQGASKAVMYCMPNCEAIAIKEGPAGLMVLPFESIQQLMRLRNKQRPLWTGSGRNKGSSDTHL